MGHTLTAVWEKNFKEGVSNTDETLVIAGQIVPFERSNDYWRIRSGSLIVSKWLPNGPTLVQVIDFQDQNGNKATFSGSSFGITIDTVAAVG